MLVQMHFELCNCVLPAVMYGEEQVSHNMSPNGAHRHAAEAPAANVGDDFMRLAAREVRNEPLAVTVIEASRLTSLGRDKIYLAIKSGALRAKKYGRRTLILRADLVNFLNNLPSLNPPG